MPLFSIIIPTYNRSELLRAALESVFCQEFTDFEVVVVDDGSTDATWATLKCFGDRVRILKQRNSGPGAARNLGASQATGKYLAFLDSDDLFFPWSLDVYAHVARSNGEPAFVAGKPKCFGQVNELDAVGREAVATRFFQDYLSSGDEWRWWGVSSFVIRRDAFETVKGFTREPINGEDADLAMRLADAPGFVQLSAPCTFGYREHSSNVKSDLKKTLAGERYKVRAEKQCMYPGGSLRALERWRILTRHIRPVTFECIQGGMRDGAWELYRATFPWHIRLGRWKYLFGFPLKAALARS